MPDALARPRDDSDAVAGVLFAITPAELDQADADYRRIRVQLKSGVYICATRTSDSG